MFQFIEQMEQNFEDQEIISVAQNDIKAILKTIEKDQVEELIENLGEEYDLDQFTSHMEQIIIKKGVFYKYVLEYYFDVDYQGVKKYCYILKISDKNEFIDNVFYLIKDE